MVLILFVHGPAIIFFFYMHIDLHVALYCVLLPTNFQKLKKCPCMHQETFVHNGTLSSIVQMKPNTMGTFHRTIKV